MRGFILFYIMVSAVSIGVISCSAPNNNPLDPDNPDNKLYVLQGTVLSDGNYPHVLEDVIVYWNNERISVETDGSGAFLLRCETSKDGWLYFQKPGFAMDSVYIQWGALKTIELKPRLNAVPVASNISLYSVVTNRYTGSGENIPLKYLYFSATVTDADDDIDHVSIRCDEFKINRELQSTNRFYSGSLASYDLATNNFEDIIGKNFQFYATVRSGKTFLVGNAEVKRIINQVVGTISPKSYDTVSVPGLRLNWSRFVPGFSFKYKVQIYTNETPAILVWTKDNISPDSVNTVVDTTLAPNYYFWRVSCVDEFNNVGSSYPASMIVARNPGK